MTDDATPEDSPHGNLGRATFDPPSVTAAAWGTYSVTYQVGTRPLGTGASVRVQLPDSWHAWRRNGAKGVQSHEPSADNYVTAQVARGTATIHCEVEGGTAEDVVKSNRVGIDGREGRYVYVTRVTVDAGRLVPGDQIVITYGDLSGGSRGFAAGLHPEGPEQVVVAVDPDGQGEAHVLPAEDSPVVHVHPGPPAELLAYLPSLLTVGEPAVLRVVVVDAEGNRVEESHDALHVEIVDGAARISASRAGGPAGTFETPIIPTAPGVLRLQVTAAGHTVLANPAWVHTQAPAHSLYWGDLHSHADHSFDGVGHFPYEYARDVACLDFYALTEHCERWDSGAWQHLCEQVTKFHQPGRFVTFLAYEATFHEPWGHHNVYFRDPADAVIVGAHTGTVLDLWHALRGRRALTVPHHTGVAFSPKTAGSIPGSTSPAVDWSHHDPEFRRAVEIYSGHGQSEFYDPEFDLSYENSDFSTNTSRNGPHYARDAWERGHTLGVVGSSDNHRAQPGRGELGLAAVYAPALERGEVFDALHDRHTYATTGARILLDFRVGDVPMGGTLRTSGPATGTVRVSGTDVLASVEVFCGRPGDAGSTEVIASWEPQGMDFETSWCDERPEAGGYRFYYVRVRQHRPYRGRRPTAWSSPVWVVGPSAGTRGDDR
ncbi:DUF3604 domain-containing protein [Streptomyces viridochromogenes]|uniref:DUF3604 domain-containing protein n=1 Tax=Streptomyces viridochromogenes Tue57 TaxID=1160705 RepID=L8PQE4_STRVR|nr:DUF3604 domain-containing protein [Streptomyces viridochromogenes]ELS58233.1 hypothetical protein STVIR_0784 [Streptomyces viridochromogenes Tue57]